MQTQKKVIYILVDESKGSGRGLLQGILSHASRRVDWQLKIIDCDDRTVMQADKLQDADGVITSEMENDSFVQHFTRSTVPLVVVGTRKSCLPRRREGLTFVTVDERNYGRVGARLLLSLGNFRSFAYVGLGIPAYDFLSDLREHGFRRELAKAGVKCRAFRKPARADGLLDQDLANWLARLPKPAALLAGYDRRAVEVMNHCEKLGIRIPEDIRVLGTNNDELTCIGTRPKLSSITTDYSAEGETAALELDRLLRRRTPQTTPRRVFVDAPNSVVVRGTTDVLPPGLALVQRAQDYIALNAATGVSVDDVVAHLGVSRRLAYLRFKEFTGTTIHAAINAARIEVVKRKLLSSQSSIDMIADTCGFTNHNQLKVIFKRLTGMTMSAWRKDHK